jgi:hypothetical protein
MSHKELDLLKEKGQARVIAGSSEAWGEGKGGDRIIRNLDQRAEPG